ncbi:MAG: cytidylate kinase [Gemmatales bacterium]|nr:MAG: cytidylate kinase [Gemmatales bacterium]
MIITIDGPAGSGKSTVAKAVAEKLGFEYLDTGAMFRAVTLAALRAGIDLHDQQALSDLLARVRMEFSPGQVVLDGEDVSQAIRADNVSKSSSPIAESPVVRQHLAERQRQLAAGRNIVCEGRDQGTVIFPHAEYKFFLVADPMERARRRHRQLSQMGEEISLEEILKTQQERDQRDSQRALAPLKPAPDALVIDTTNLTIDEVVARIVDVVQGRLP